jgi:PhnB protein
MQFTTCLYFTGACEDALRFYEACGLGEIQELRRYQGTPMEARHGAAWRDKVLHSVFVGPGLRIAASDGPDSEPMKGCAIMIELDDAAAAQRLFGTLSADGRITVAFAKQFWGDHYGNFTDKFGVQWAINAHTIG